jgi:hypothetical protein
MSDWRSKVMSDDDWPAFQNAYEELFIACGGDEEMALFIKRGPGEAQHTVLIPTQNADMVERLSPGEWGDRQNPQDVEWILLVGRSDAADHFGLRLGSN